MRPWVQGFVSLTNRNVPVIRVPEKLDNWLKRSWYIPILFISPALLKCLRILNFSFNVGFNSYIFIQDVLGDSKIRGSMAQSSASSFPFPISSLGVTSLFVACVLSCSLITPSFMVPSSVSIYFQTINFGFVTSYFLI